VDFSSFASFKCTVEQIDFTPFFCVTVIDFDFDYFYVAYILLGYFIAYAS